MAFSNYLKEIGLPDGPAEDYDKAGDVLYSEYQRCIDEGGVGFEEPDYTVTPLVIPEIDMIPLGDINYYSYDTIIAVCLAFNRYIDAVAKGLQELPWPILPPASLSGLSSAFFTQYTKEKTQQSVKITKPSAPDQDESLPFVDLFYGACGKFLYNIYADA